jgi:hypothetical protein
MCYLTFYIRPMIYRELHCNAALSQNALRIANRRNRQTVLTDNRKQMHL